MNNFFCSEQGGQAFFLIEIEIYGYRYLKNGFCNIRGKKSGVLLGAGQGGPGVEIDDLITLNRHF